MPAVVGVAMLALLLGTLVALVALGVPWPWAVLVVAIVRVRVRVGP